MRPSLLFNRTTIILMTTFVSWRLNILCFKIITLFSWLYLRVGILLTYGKHLHDCIISLREEVLAHKISLTITIIYWNACTKPGMWAVMYLWASFYNFSIGFWKWSNSVVFFVYYWFPDTEFEICQITPFNTRFIQHLLISIHWVCVPLH